VNAVGGAIAILLVWVGAAVSSPGVAHASDGYVCTDGFNLDLDDVAVVTNGSGTSVTLRESVFTGEAIVFTLDGKASSCDRQAACVSGIYNDTWCDFYV
jgi:hypothetical protein